jgi:hypothetical protein
VPAYELGLGMSFLWFVPSSYRRRVCARRVLFHAVLGTVASCLLCPGAALSLEVTVTWDSNADLDIAGYRVYVGSESRNYSSRIRAGNNTACFITGLEDGKRYYFTVTAYTRRFESGYSEEVCYPCDLGVNLLNNGGFERGDLRWWRKAGVSIGGQSRYGGEFGAKVSDGGRIYQHFRTLRGRHYTVSGRIRIDKEMKKPLRGGLSVRVLNAFGAKLAESQYLTAQNSPEGEWTEVTLSFLSNTNRTYLFFSKRGDGRFEASVDDFIVRPD